MPCINFGKLRAQSVVRINCGQGLADRNGELMRLLMITRVLAISCLLTSSMAFAGNDGQSGGGNAVVCRSANGKIKSAEVLDLYEGRTMENLSYDTGAGLALEQRLEIAVDKFKRSVEITDDKLDYNSLPYWFYQDADRLGQVSVINYLKNFDRFFQVLPDEAKLPPLDDSHEIVVPVGCAVERLALYQKNKIFLVGAIWRRLDATNKAALIFHEAAYKYDRDLNEARDSVNARKIVARFMSKEKVESVLAGVPVSAAKCTWSQRVQERAGQMNQKWTQFFIYRDNAGAYHARFISVFGQQMYSKTEIKFTKPILNRNQPVGQELSSWIPLPPMKFTYQDYGVDINTNRQLSPYYGLQSLGGDGWPEMTFRLLDPSYGNQPTDPVDGRYPMFCDKAIP